MVRAEPNDAMKNKPLVLAILSAAVLLGGPATFPMSAQLAVPPPMPAYQPLSDQQLDQLLGPIALYPDPLLAQILPAATLPTQIVLADRYVTGGGDPNQIDQQPWDVSVQALARYPSVLQYLDNNLAWTTDLGQAFLNQQQDVMESIQRLRLSAQNFGNLQSTPQQQVVDDNGDVEILPADPDVIYVPVYQPDVVYFQSGYGLGFGVACTLGPWLACDFDWAHHSLMFWDRNHPRPANWWHERPDQRVAWMARQGTVWRAADHRDVSRANGGDRGWNNAVTHPGQPHNNNMIINMSKPGVTPRPAARPMPEARPMPAAVHTSGAFQTPNRPAPDVRPANNGAFIGSESSHDARTFSNRGQESVQTITRPEPARSEPVREAPVSHSAPSGGGGGGEGAHGSQPRR